MVKPPVKMTTLDKIVLKGFAVDQESRTRCLAVEVFVGGSPHLTTYGKSRPDVATYFGEPGFENSGFSFRLPAAAVGPGTHELRLRIHLAGRPAYLETLGFPFVVE